MDIDILLAVKLINLYVKHSSTANLFLIILYKAKC